MKFKINSYLSGGGILVAALMATNFLNFLFNAILGRVLTLEQFSILTLVNSLWFLLTIFLNSLASTTTNRTAYLVGKRGESIALGFRKFIVKRAMQISIGVALLWVVLLPVFFNVFHTSDALLFLSISPAIVLGIFAAVHRGFFAGTFSFAKAALIILAESVSKIIYALIFIGLGYSNLAYLSIPLSIFSAFLVALVLVFFLPKKRVEYHYIFPKKLLFATFLTVFSGTAFLSIDILLARHYLSPTQSGIYALLSLVGKMLYFLGSLFSVFILTFASRDTGENKNSTHNFYRILGINIALLFVGYISLGTFGSYVIPMLFGQKGITVLPYLPIYLMAIVFFVIANSFVTFHLAKQQFIFAYNGVFIMFLAFLGLSLFHENINEFIYLILLTSYLYLAINLILHVFYKDVSAYIDEEDVKLFKDAQRLNESTKSLSVSICIPAYNEEKNIGSLLRGLVKQETKHVAINKIVVVSSLSTDNTDKIVEGFVKKYPKKIQLIKEFKRLGKAHAINTFLKICNDPVVVVQSADTLAMKDTIEKLCRPFLVDKKIGMTGGAPIPVNDKNTFLGFVIHTWWWFHRNIPRFGEIIAFRNIIGKVSPRTAVDEAYIQAKFAQKGYKIVHIDEARIYNKGSENLSDIIKQRRRIFNGHTRLQKEENIHISHMTKSGVKLLLFEYKMYGPSQFMWLLGGIGIELWANVLGRYDKWVNKVNPVAWDIATSTKDLSGGKSGRSTGW